MDTWPVSRGSRCLFRVGLRSSEAIPTILLSSLRGGSRERDDLTKDELLPRFLQMEKKIDKLEEKFDRKDERIEEQQGRVEELESRLRKYENPNAPPNEQRSGTDEFPTSQDDDGDDVRT